MPSAKSRLVHNRSAGSLSQLAPVEALESRQLLSAQFGSVVPAAGPYETADLSTTGTLNVYGTELSNQPTTRNDTIRIVAADSKLNVVINLKQFTFDAAAVQRINVKAYSGSDRIELAGGVPSGLIDAGDDDDSIIFNDGVTGNVARVVGGSGTDWLEVDAPTFFSRSVLFDAGPAGASGKQAVYYNGSLASEHVTVEFGTLHANSVSVIFSQVDLVQVDVKEGDDFVRFNSPDVAGIALGGEGDDTLIGGLGQQQLSGGPGDDLLVSTDTGTDVVLGGTGRDVAYLDELDTRGSDVETRRTTSIAGSVFRDENGDGARDDFEQGVPNELVHIDLNHDFRPGFDEPNGYTDALGRYRIPVFEPGDVRVRRVSAAETSQTFPANAADWEVTIQENQSVVGCGFALEAPAGEVSLEGTVYHDRSADSRREDDEDALEGWTIFDDANLNNQLDDGETFSVSDADGRYVLTAPAARVFHVRRVDQPASGYFPEDPTVYGYDLAVSTQATQGFDFGLVRGYSARGVYFNDLDGDGHRSANEPPLAGWTIEIYYHDFDEFLGSVVTDADGRYSIGELPADQDYVLLRPAAPAGWVQTQAVGLGINFSPFGSAVWTDVDFSAREGALVDGFVYDDMNVDGNIGPGESHLGGWVVYADLNNDGVRQSSEPYDVTERSGWYEFGVPPDVTFTLRPVPPTGFRPVSPSSGTQLCNLPAGSALRRANFGFTSTNVVVGLVFDDPDQNGFRTDNESALGGVTIWDDVDNDAAFDPDERSTTTEANGWFRLDALPIGVHHIRQVLPPGRLQTFPAHPAWDLTLKGGENIGVYFGSYLPPPPGRISGFVFADDNDNGRADAGENHSLPDIVVYLDQNDNAALDPGEPSAVTQAQGYAFDGLSPALHVVRVVVPDDLKQTFPAPDSAQRILTGPGLNVADVNFGLASRFAPQSLTLNPAADAYVRDGSSAGANYGSTTDLFVKKASAGFARDAYLRFDLQNIQSPLSAKLRLFGSLSPTGNPISIALYGSSDVVWSESGINWNNKPAADAASIGTLSVSGSTGQWYEFDVSDYVRARLAAGASAVTFLLRGTAVTTPAAVFNSREATTNRPELVVTSAATAPAVESIVVRGAGWSQSFIDRLSADALGANGFSLPAAGSGLPLPWTNLDQIAIRFTQNVVVAKESLHLNGVAAAAIQNFSYDSATRTARWALAAPLGAGRWHVDLSGVATTSGVPLSSQGAARDFTMLPADVDRSGGSVNASDLVKVRNRIGRSVQQPGGGATAYDVFADLNGDGNINASDLVLVRNRVGSSLPAALRAAVQSTFASVLLVRLPSESVASRLTDDGDL